jgi:K+-sensing histidine kinase KdpD
MTRYLTRDRAAIAAALVAPLAAAAILLPLRSSWPNTNVALLLVVVVVAVAAAGNRLAGAIAAVGAAVWFDFMLTPAPGSRPSLQARLVASTLAGHAGRALAAATPSRSIG